MHKVAGCFDPMRPSPVSGAVHQRLAAASFCCHCADIGDVIHVWFPAHLLTQKDTVETFPQFYRSFQSLRCRSRIFFRHLLQTSCLHVRNEIDHSTESDHVNVIAKEIRTPSISSAVDGVHKIERGMAAAQSHIFY